jgi:hypothetical protein
MAFFASLDHLPAARASWRTKKPKPPVPPVPPPKPPPPKKPTSGHHCTDGYERVKVYQFGIFMGWTCDKIKNPAVNQRVDLLNTQVTGRIKPLIKPHILYADKTQLNTSNFKSLISTATTDYVEENVEDN